MPKAKTVKCVEGVVVLHTAWKTTDGNLFDDKKKCVICEQLLT